MKFKLNKRKELNITKKKLREIKLEEDRCKVKDGLEKLKKQQKMVAKIQSRCNIMGVHDMVDFFNYLGVTNEQLMAQKEILEQQKKEKLEILIATKSRFDNIRFKEQRINQNAINYSHTLKCIENEDSYIEPHINDFFSENKIVENDFQKQRLARLHSVLST